MSLQSKILCAAVLGVVVGCGTKDKTPEQLSPGSGDANASSLVRCFGVNSCKGMSKCAVTQEEIEATRTMFGDKFAKTELHDCSGTGSCAGKDGQLAWVQISQKECFEKSGFLIVDDETGVKKIQTK